MIQCVTLGIPKGMKKNAISISRLVFLLVLKSSCLLITKYCQTETNNLSKRININYLFYHLFDKNIRSSFFIPMNESRQKETPADVNPKLDLLLKNMGGSTKININ